MPMIDEYNYVRTDKGLNDFIAKLNLAGSNGWRPIWQNAKLGEGKDENIYFCFIFRKYSTTAREREAQKFWEKKQEEEKKKQEAKFKGELEEMGKELKEEEAEEAEEEKKRTVRAVFKDGKRVE